MWEAMAECIRRSAKEVLGVSRVGRGRINRPWWWNEVLKEKIREKQYAYATLNDSRMDKEKEENKAKYKATKTIAKKGVTITKNSIFERYIRN